MADEPLATVPLDGLHRELGAKMVPFAGYAMPVQYRDGIIREHHHTRSQAGLFDVSHMGQLRLHGPSVARVLEAMEALTPGDLQEMAPDSQRYTVLTTDDGGIIDDFMLQRRQDHVYMVLNAARVEAGLAHLRTHLPADVTVTPLTGWGLLALQGPAVDGLLPEIGPSFAELRFMQVADGELCGIPVSASRSGYTGEDGLEISVPPDQVATLARRLLDHAPVAPVGLGARDTLRLEAGLCLYGEDIDTTTTPVEAGITFVVGKRRRQEGGFPGAAHILDQIAQGSAVKRVAFTLDGRAPARHGAPVLDPSDGSALGTVTSGSYAPTVGGPIGMAYVPRRYARPGTGLAVQVRRNTLRAQVTRLPVVPHNYKM